MEFDERTSQPFEQYHKDIQNIILKDKIQKELTEMLDWWCLGGVTTYFQFLHTITAVIEAGNAVGVAKDIDLVGQIYYLAEVRTFNFITKITPANFYNPNKLVQILHEACYKACDTKTAQDLFAFPLAKEWIEAKGAYNFLEATAHQSSVDTQTTELEAATITKSGDAATSTSTVVSNFFTNPIGISIIVIIIIVVLLLTINLILRYRRKINMKKKLPKNNIIEISGVWLS
ncbi:rifin PIR protein, putative [Plasmodium gaboni]|uniref:Rifin PIR protein, putative n=1 Tax=Plasmodium gaboni TaxID=647221 RepID=A0ABY1UHY8_9APIC|nr:rifin PIR protein, putative [Plasmodium gaboni]